MARVVISSILSLGTKLVATIQSSPSNSSSAFENDLRWIMRTLERIQATLSDMERREIGEEAVKLWLKQLKEVAYDAEDVLDEYYYEVTKAKVEARGEETRRCSRKRKLYSSSSSSLLSSYFPSSSSLSIKFPTVDGMAERMKAICSRIEEIVKAWEKLRLREEDGRRRPSIKRDPPQLLTETRKEEVINLLLSAHDNKVAVFAIVGKRGLGKTTLAELVYKDQRIYERFRTRAWIRVYENFDVKRLTKAIVESFTANSSLTELSELQDNLMNLVRGKNVFLVLDDVWIERKSQWELLRAPLMAAETATILMTTRNVSVANIMRTMPPYFLDYLPEDQCWSLFKHYAFTGVDSNEQPNLVEIGRQIMNKCGGLPLAVKLLASLLRIKVNEDSWRDVLESDEWRQSQEEDETSIALEISYQRMPPHLKPCFWFFSMFPKDHYFNKNELFRLWVAQGYVQSEGTKTMDEIAFGYVDELTERSFLEQCDFGPFYTSYDEMGTPKYRMHNLVHDLAIKLSRDEYFQPADDVLPDLARVRHLHISSDIGSVFLRNPTALRTLVVDKFWSREILLRVISKSPCLRALVLKGNIEMGFPEADSIRNLKNLRYIYLHCPISKTLVKCLCLLYNLQILILNEVNISNLPKEMGNLVNLQYLKISGSFMPKLRKLPKSICFLSNLQILILNSHYHLEELPEGLGNLVDLRHLEVCSCQIKVLPRSICQLNHLQKLILSGCKWLFDLPSLIGNLQNLRDLNLVHSGVKYIPPGIHKLTTLQSLKGRFIAKIGHNHIGMGFLRDLVNLKGNLKIYNLGDIDNSEDAKNANLKSKRNLRELTLSWRKWEDASFSNNDIIVQLEAFRGVVVGSKIDGQILEFLQPHTNLNKLEINGYRATAFPSWMADPFSCASLASISILDCFQLRSLNFGNLSSVKSLIISKCHNLVEGSLPSRLQSLCIKDCWKLKLLDVRENLMSLENLQIYNCQRLYISPTNSLPDKLLPENITIYGCRKLTEWCQQHNIVAWEANDEDGDVYETDEEDDEEGNEEEDE